MFTPVPREIPAAGACRLLRGLAALQRRETCVCVCVHVCVCVCACGMHWYVNVGTNLHVHTCSYEMTYILVTACVLLT